MIKQEDAYFDLKKTKKTVSWGIVLGSILYCFGVDFRLCQWRSSFCYIITSTNYCVLVVYNCGVIPIIAIETSLNIFKLKYSKVSLMPRDIYKIIIYKDFFYVYMVDKITRKLDRSDGQQLLWHINIDSPISRQWWSKGI